METEFKNNITKIDNVWKKNQNDIQNNIKKTNTNHKFGNKVYSHTIITSKIKKIIDLKSTQKAFD